MTSLLTSDLADETVFETARCEAHGEFQQRVLDPGFGMTQIRSRCPTCSAEKAAAERKRDDQAKAQQREYDVAMLVQRSGVPARFLERTFGDYDPECKAAKMALAVCRRYADDFRSQAERGRSIVLTGGPGTGKTHLACAIANAVIEAHVARVRFTTVSDMLRRIKETYRKDSERSESEVIAGFVNCDLLIVDEIGVQIGSEHEKLLLFEVLNQRYQDLQPTILISNLSADELETFLGHRVMDRYRECGVVLAFDWESYRGRKAA